MVEDSNKKANSEELESSQQEVTSPTPDSAPEPENEAAAPEVAEVPVAESLAEAEQQEESPSADSTETISTVEESTSEPVEEVKLADTAGSEAPDAGDTVASNTEGETDTDTSTADEDDGESEAEEEEEYDYTHHTKEQLVDVVEALHHSDDLRKVGKILKVLRPAFDEIIKGEAEEAKVKFVEEGGDADGFEFRPDEHMTRFEKAFGELRHKVKQQIKDREQSKQTNYEKKSELLEKLRELVDGEESTTSMKVIKDLQEEWKAIGSVPPQHNKNLWANYNALLDRFYDNRSIYYELKELDRKKNLEKKNELVKRAEALEKVENLKDAIKELNDLHEEFKHIGPVPKDDQEELWQRFKAASDRVYDRRREYLTVLKEDLNKNMMAKKELGDQIQAFVSFDSDRINEWNKKTKEILEFQKKWETIGGLPRDKAKEVNKHFWTAFKTFFNHKSQFFKKLEGQREENLKKKQELVSRAESLQQSTDWDKTAEDLKKLQKEWREVGPVPEKFRDSVFAEFKAACDAFFQARRGANNEKESEFQDNLNQKETICKKIQALAEIQPVDLEQLETLMDDYAEIGFVPRNAIKKIQNKFNAAVDKVLDVADVEDFERERIKMSITVNKLKGGPNAKGKIHRKEDAIRRQIRKLEDDISLWNNNLEFFASSATADKLREEFDGKISKANEEIKTLRAQLRVLRNA